jgi:hypothetical protein
MRSRRLNMSQEAQAIFHQRMQNMSPAEREDHRYQLYTGDEQVE